MKSDLEPRLRCDIYAVENGALSVCDTEEDVWTICFISFGEDMWEICVAQLRVRHDCFR